MLVIRERCYFTLRMIHIFVPLAMNCLLITSTNQIQSHGYPTAKIYARIFTHHIPKPMCLSVHCISPSSPYYLYKRTKAYKAPRKKPPLTPTTSALHHTSIKDRMILQFRSHQDKRINPRLTGLGYTRQYKFHY